MANFRWGYNVNGQRVGDESYFLDHIAKLQPIWLLIMNNPALAVRVLDVSPQTNVIDRSWSSHEGRQWRYMTPVDYTNSLKGGDKRVWRYLLNEPNVTSATEAQQRNDWLVEVSQLMVADGYRVVVGNFASGSWESSHIDAGAYDNLLRFISDHPGVAKLGLHEYGAIVLPFNKDRYMAQHLTDRNMVQPDTWLYLGHDNEALRLPDYRHEYVGHFYHLLRSHWLQRRCQAIGITPVEIVMTEFGWDYLPDLSSQLYETLKNQHGIPSPYTSIQGPYTLANVWQHYWGWDVSTAILKQWQWCDANYIPGWYVGFCPFMWSAGDHWDVVSGYHYGADTKLHRLMEGWASSDPDPPVIIQEPETMIDLLAYMRGDGRVYELTYHFPGMGSGHQHVQTERTAGRRFFHVKGDRDWPDIATWEELWYAGGYIRRGTDFSPSMTEFYQVTEDGQYGQQWISRFVKVGDKHRANPLVMFRYKADGRQVPDKPVYAFPHWIEVKHRYDRYTFPEGFVLDDVVELWGYLDEDGQPGANFERYYYAKYYGLVAWTDPQKNWVSYIVADYGHEFTLHRLHPDWLVLPELPPLDKEEPPVKFPDFDDPRWRTVFLSASTDYDFWNVRPGPNIQQPRVTKIDRGQARHALILTETPSEQADGRWYPVRLADDLYAPMDDSPGTRELYHITGWVRADGIVIEDYTPAPDPEPAPDPRVFQYFIPSAEVGLTPAEAQDRADWIDWFLSHHLDGMPGSTIEGDRHWFRWLSDFVRHLPTILDGHDAIMVIEPPEEGEG